jgi:hypothetical protein
MSKAYIKYYGKRSIHHNTRECVYNILKEMLSRNPEDITKSDLESL